MPMATKSFSPHRARLRNRGRRGLGQHAASRYQQTAKFHGYGEVFRSYHMDLVLYVDDVVHTD